VWETPVSVVDADGNRLQVRSSLRLDPFTGQCDD
jgi:hypothetical protein